MKKITLKSARILYHIRKQGKCFEIDDNIRHQFKMVGVDNDIYIYTLLSKWYRLGFITRKNLNLKDKRYRKYCFNNLEKMIGLTYSDIKRLHTYKWVLNNYQKAIDHIIKQKKASSYKLQIKI